MYPIAKRKVAKEVLILTACLIGSFLVYGFWYTFLSPVTRIHPYTGEELIIYTGTDKKAVWQIISTLFIAVYPIRFFYYLVKWAVKTLKEPLINA